MPEVSGKTIMHGVEIVNTYTMNGNNSMKDMILKYAKNLDIEVRQIKGGYHFYKGEELLAMKSGNGKAIEFLDQYKARMRRVAQ